MICPLLRAGGQAGLCFEDRCAWWDDGDELCSLTALSIKLTGLENALVHILGELRLEMKR